MAAAADLVAGVVGHSRNAPALHARNVQLRQGHRGSAAALSAANAASSRCRRRRVGFVVGFGGHRADQLVQVVVAGSEDSAVVVGADSEHQSFAVGVEQQPDGLITWTTPTGHRYSSRPHDYRPEPDLAAVVPALDRATATKGDPFDRPIPPEEADDPPPF